MLKLQITASYRKSYKRLKKRGYDMSLLNKAITILQTEKRLPAEYLDHPLQGNYEGYRECHIRPDWILIYTVYRDRLVLVLADTGTHSDLFKR